MHDRVKTCWLSAGFNALICSFDCPAFKFFFIFKQTEQEIDIDKIGIVNETVRVTNASSTETVTNTLGQKFHITQVLAYDNTGSVSNNFYKVLPNMLEITKLCNINFFTKTQF